VSIKPFLFCLSTAFFDDLRIRLQDESNSQGVGFSSLGPTDVLESPFVGCNTQFRRHNLIILLLLFYYKILVSDGKMYNTPNLVDKRIATGCSHRSGSSEAL
jgi:hypothetical protein